MANLKDTFVLGKLTVTDSIIADKFKGPLEGNAATAIKFNTSRTFSFGGDVSGTVTTDCASGFEVSLSVLNNSHSHTYDNITNLDTPLTNYLNTAKAYTDDKIAALIDSSPDLLNTLNELAAAINDDPNFATTVADNIATKLSKTGGTMSGAITFNASTVDAIKYAGSKATYTMIKFINNTADANGNGIMIGGGGSVYIGSGESAANLYSALSSPSGGTEAIHISGDDAIKFYSNCQTIANRKETTYDNSGNWTMPGTITATQFTGPSKALYSSGFGDGTLTYLQTSSDFNGNSGWAHYLIANHGDGEIYYNYTIALPFWGAPKYRRKTGYSSGGASADRATNATANLSEWFDFVTSENYHTILDNTYLQLTGGTMSGGLTVNGKATFTGGVDIRGNAADKPLIVRGIAGSDGSGTVDDLYLQYGANKPVHFGNEGSYTISASGADYSGNSATATILKTARNFTIGNTARSFNGSASVAWTPNDIGYRYEWNASVRGVTWSRLCNMGAAVNVEGSKYILNISATRGNVVYNDTFLITAHHASNGKIIKIAGNNYTSGHQIRLLVNSNGDSYVELYDNAQSITTATYQTVRCRIIPIFTGTPTLYTSFTNGTTLPTGYSVKQTMTINTTDMQGNLSGNADTATAVLDYGNTAKTIQIGFEGAGLSTTSYFAAYDHSNANVRKIKDISVANTKTVLGLIQKGGTAQPVYFDSNGSPAACSATVGGISKPVFMSAGTITECSANIGGTAKPVYMSGGAITECSSTVGESTSQPVYMNAGTITGMTRVGVAYGGTGKSSWTANSMIYSSGTTTLSNAHYVSGSKLAVNTTSEPSYNFYVNGSSYFNGDIYWKPLGNICCVPTGNDQEWSFDVGASGYTGSMWHVWSSTVGASILSCYSDDRRVAIPVKLDVASLALSGSQIANASVGGTYVKARDFALIRHTTSTTNSSFSALISGKTQAGEISCGIIHPYEQMEWIYSNDTGYANNTNNASGYTRILAVNSAGAVTAASYNATSDKRLKTNIRDFTPSASILDLPLYRFDFINGAKNQIGCMAQDLQFICPEIVLEDPNNGYLSINESKIVYLLIDEIRKLKNQVTFLINNNKGEV